MIHHPFEGQAVARAQGTSLPISTKQSIEITKHIRFKTVTRAKRILQDAIDEKRAIPFTRFTDGLGHKSGMAAGRYNPSAARAILAIVSAAQKNAENKGITGELILLHIAANQASRPYHHGRQRRAKMKQTHIVVVVGDASLRIPTKKSAHAAEKKAARTVRQHDATSSSGAASSASVASAPHTTRAPAAKKTKKKVEDQA